MMCLFWIISCLFVSVYGCPAGWQSNGTYCYFFSPIQSTWMEASSFCRSFGAELAEPMDKPAGGFIAEQVKTGTTEEYYIGGTDIFHEGTWVWSSTLQTIELTNWNTHEPNNAKPNEDCLLVVTNGHWNDEPCTEKHRFICQLENENGLGIVG